MLLQVRAQISLNVHGTFCSMLILICIIVVPLSKNFCILIVLCLFLGLLCINFEFDFDFYSSRLVNLSVCLLQLFRLNARTKSPNRPVLIIQSEWTPSLVLEKRPTLSSPTPLRRWVAIRASLRGLRMPCQLPLLMS